MVKTFSGSGPVLFRVDADARRGLERLEECDTLASALVSWGFDPIRFIVNDEDSAIQWAERSRYDYSHIPAADPEREVFHVRDVQESLSPAVQIIYTSDNSPEYLNQVRRSSLTLVSLCDHSHLPPIHQGLVFSLSLASWQRMATEETARTVHAGPEYALLNPAYQILSRKRAEGFLSQDSHNRILVLADTGRGAGVSLALLREIARAGQSVTTTVLIDEMGAEGETQLMETVRECGGEFRILSGLNSQDRAALLASCEVAVSIHTRKTYELACLGVPAVLVSVEEEDGEEAAAFEGCEMAVHVDGRGEDAASEAWKRVHALLEDEKRRETMAQRARERVDGHGADRVARLIAEACEAETF